MCRDGHTHTRWHTPLKRHIGDGRAHLGAKGQTSGIRSGLGVGPQLLVSPGWGDRGGALRDGVLVRLEVPNICQAASELPANLGQ